MGDTKPFCDLCEMLPNGRHVFGCPADDGVPSAAPAPDTMREAFEAFHAYRKPSKGVAKRESMFARLPDDSYVDDSVQRHWWTWQNAVEAGRQQGPSDDMKQAIVTTVNDAVDAAFERGRQLGMEQARRELVKSSREIEAKPVFWAVSWALDDLDKVFAYGNDVLIRIWRNPADKAGLSPLYTTPPAGDSDTKERR